MIQPQSGIPSQPANSFLAQIGFTWPLNYPWVSANDNGNQIMAYTVPAVANALNITEDKVVMQGLKPFDTTAEQGFITTLALFYMPADMKSSLQNQLLNPVDAFWHNENQTIRSLTDLVNPMIPLESGPTPESSGTTADPEASGTGGSQGGDPMDGDSMAASRQVNPMSAGIAVGAVTGAIAYGAAMFFVARRYRNKKLSHQRSSSVPSTSRFTYGSMQGGGAAFMSGGRGPGGSTTPGGRDSRGSRGSSSSQGRSIRTQQISAPVMAENSLGWN
jgi:hypothetical protein